MLCELCSMNKADVLVWIENELWKTSRRRTLAYLCHFCLRELEDAHVKFKVIKEVLERGDTKDG